MFVTEIRNIPYFDGHCDTIYECMGKGRSLRENSGHVDLVRGQRYGRRAQFFALFDNVRELPEGTAWTKLCQMHDWFCAQAAENADVMALCRTGAEVDAAAAQHKTAALLSIEGADLLTATWRIWRRRASWACGLLNPAETNRCHVRLLRAGAERGLSARGVESVARMEELGIHTDVSHISDAGFWDVLRRAKRACDGVPPIPGAGGVPPPAESTDDMFRAIRDTGGVVGINLYADFVGGDSMEQLIAHIERSLSLDGEKTVALGGDLDGCEALAGSVGVHDVSEAYQALEERGHCDAAGGYFLEQLATHTGAKLHCSDATKRQNAWHQIYSSGICTRRWAATSPWTYSATDGRIMWRRSALASLR